MLTVGEFSKITGLTVKTLRFYHEQGVLAPTCVDENSGYRYYAENKVETARVIVRLRALGFPLTDIVEILSSHNDDADIVEHLERRKRSIEETIQTHREMSRSLSSIITKEREARAAMQNANYEIEEKAVDAMLIAGIRMIGKYSDCGKGFGQIGWQFGRHICGKPLMLHYDSEYKETDADFEACMPIRKGESKKDISVRQLPGGRCVSLLHKGPYEELGRSYEKILAFVREKGYEVEIPTREVYIKGPGMIFRGNPNNYLTEIQMFIKE